MSNPESPEVHPIDLFEQHPEGGFPKNELSLLLARAGVGKTAALINFALREMLRGQHVLHFSVGMNSEKVHHYYQELFHEYVVRFHDHHQPMPWSELTHHLTVVSYSDGDRMANQLSPELATLLTHASIRPSLVLIDGLDADAHLQANLQHLQRAAQEQEMRLIACVRLHRTPDGHLDVQSPFKQARPFARRIYLMDTFKDEIRLDALLEHVDQGVPMPVHFCPNDLMIAAN